ncbi:MOSC domain-containing protein [Colletotrichum tofieldiae]|uniref:MOSC domain-containing protein n=1 Tax=Colletotrichum tofieldiae TaxID=708197 RepID=A0A161VJX6_9PEZI|nr:MOSC domain-containing protein [Colletotrichum tofieldiae]GKT59360.1 MOSC domain-containing protein [Colletotrichum tofieldiae]GKT79927.1 MOSC domain-containing protein [Colletotrichum tofieldiae]
MKIQALNVYPIKALRPIPLEAATLTPQGILHDRTYMLFKVNPDSSLRKLQLSTFPQCALFSQEIVPSPSSSDEGPGDTILVKYNTPNPPLVDHHPLQDTALSVPLVPDTSTLKPVFVDLHGSPAEALRMGDPYDAFFSACFGFPTILVHIGSGRRRVLGTLSPGSSSPASSSKQQRQQSSSLFASIASYLPSFSTPEARDEEGDDPAWLTFTDCAPYLVTSNSSLSYASLTSFQGSPIMPKFRPNIVVEDPAEAPFAEDFWAELSLAAPGTGTPAEAKLLLTANCGRCSSLNVDYDLGRAAAGQEGKLLNTLMKDRRVDPGHKYAPVFGRYAFLAVDGAGEEPPRVRVRVGDEVVVSRRNAERTVFDWDLSAPAKKATAVA